MASSFSYIDFHSFLARIGKHVAIFFVLVMLINICKKIIFKKNETKVTNTHNLTARYSECRAKFGRWVAQDDLSSVCWWNHDCIALSALIFWLCMPAAPSGRFVFILTILSGRGSHSALSWHDLLSITSVMPFCICVEAKSPRTRSGQHFDRLLHNVPSKKYIYPITTKLSMFVEWTLLLGLIFQYLHVTASNPWVKTFLIPYLMMKHV